MRRDIPALFVARLPDELAEALALALDVVGLGVSVVITSPTTTPVAGVTGVAEPLAFWYAP